MLPVTQKRTCMNLNGFLREKMRLNKDYIYSRGSPREEGDLTEIVRALVYRRCNGSYNLGRQDLDVDLPKTPHCPILASS